MDLFWSGGQALHINILVLAQKISICKNHPLPTSTSKSSQKLLKPQSQGQFLNNTLNKICSMLLTGLFSFPGQQKDQVRKQQCFSGRQFLGEILSVPKALNSRVTGSLERLKLQLTITNQFQTLTLTEQTQIADSRAATFAAKKMLCLISSEHSFMLFTICVSPRFQMVDIRTMQHNGGARTVIHSFD